MDRIFLIGFMGAGKTTVGRILSRRLGWTFLDLDEEIERAEGCTVAELFRDAGECYFRRIESALLEQLSRRAHCVVALGGGTYLDARNRARVEDSGASVFLDVPLAEIETRIARDGSRPLFSDDCQIEGLYEQRRPSYKMARVTIDARGLDPEEVAERVIETLGRL